MATIMSAELPPPQDLDAEEHELVRVQSRRFWAAMMLALDIDTCESILGGLRVRVGNLDAFFLRRALRDAPLPDIEDYIEITVEMLDAVAEAGPLPDPRGVRR
jgi:hypothetical protein